MTADSVRQGLFSHEWVMGVARTAAGSTHAKRRYHAHEGDVEMPVNGDDRGTELSDDAQSRAMFEASHRGKTDRDSAPWGGPKASFWKRVLAAIVRSGAERPLGLR